MSQETGGWLVWPPCKRHAGYPDGLLRNLETAQWLNHCVDSYDRLNDSKHYGVKIWAFKKVVKGREWQNNIFQNSLPESCILPERDNVLMGKSCKEEEQIFSEKWGKLL